MFGRRRARERQNPEPVRSTDAPPITVETEGLSFALANLQGIGKRENQEDSFAFGSAIDPAEIGRKGLLAIVADGMGGLEGGETASKTAVTALLSAYEDMDPEQDPARQLEDAVYKADMLVTQKLRGRGGSTLVAGFIHREQLTCVSVGDSGIFLLHDRKLTRLNRSHNKFARVILDGIDDREYPLGRAGSDPEKDALTNYMGMDGLEEVDIFRRPLTLSAGDVLLLCSDGIYGVLSHEQLESCLHRATPAEMCAAMREGIETANLRYQDNFTALIVQCNQ